MVNEVARGHRLLPHTADVIVEAWGSSHLECVEEAAQALIEICVSGEPDPTAGHWQSMIDAPRHALLASVLDEVVFALDTSELTPVSARLVDAGDLGVEIRIGLARPDAVSFTGAAPKAVVIIDSDPPTQRAPCRCRFIVDV